MKFYSSLLIAFACSFTSALAQIQFEKGYIIDNTGSRIECLIKNQDWKTTPEKFSIKRAEDAPSEEGSIENIKGFGIYGDSKFERHILKMDASEALTTDRNPTLVLDTAFLKLLVDGSAKLYQFKEIFLFSVKDSVPEQLIYRKYKVKIYDQSTNFTKWAVVKNETYKQQLLNTVNCVKGDARSLNSLRYGKPELIEYFSNHNKCVDPTYREEKQTAETKSKNRDKVNLKLTLGFDLGKAKFSNEMTGVNMDITMPTELNFRAGIDFEYVLPFNKNKWRIFIEPTYQSYSGSLKEPVDPSTVFSPGTSVFSYKSIEVPIGVRYYMFITDNKTIFIDGAVKLWEFPTDETLILYKKQYSMELEPKIAGCLAFGAGVTLGKYSIGTRYYLGRSVTVGYGAWGSSYQKLSFIAGYKLF